MHLDGDLLVGERRLDEAHVHPLPALLALHGRRHGAVVADEVVGHVPLEGRVDVAGVHIGDPPFDDTEVAHTSRSWPPAGPLRPRSLRSLMGNPTGHT